jgi:hypothetical protein
MGEWAFIPRESERCRRGSSRTARETQAGDSASGKATNTLTTVRGGRVRAAGGESAGCAAEKRTSGWWKSKAADENRDTGRKVHFPGQGSLRERRQAADPAGE